MESVAVAYVPVIHKGYKQFFAACSERGARALFLLGPPFTDTFLALQRDLRALPAKEIQAMVKTLPFFSSVEVILYLVGVNLVKQARRVFLPDEDISRDFAEKHLLPGQAEFLSIFLRWDMRALSLRHVPQHHRVVPVSALDRELMRKAQDEALRSPDWWRQIGAVAVKNGEILCRAFNEHMPAEQVTYIEGDPRSNFNAGDQNDFYCSVHSEQSILAQAAREKGIGLLGASLYVTTFPCSRCARMIALAGIARMYYAEGYSTFDADKVLARAGVEVIHVDSGG